MNKGLALTEIIDPPLTALRVADSSVKGDEQFEWRPEIGCDVILTCTFACCSRHLSSAICCLNQGEVSEVTVAGGVARGTDSATAAHLAVTSTFCGRKTQRYSERKT